eukprot:140017-Chlamydomonas_euryale.AAC.1
MHMCARVVGCCASQDTAPTSAGHHNAAKHHQRRHSCPYPSCVYQGAGCSDLQRRVHRLSSSGGGASGGGLRRLMPRNRRSLPSHQQPCRQASRAAPHTFHDRRSSAIARRV